jgi:hypothetical protein
MNLEAHNDHQIERLNQRGGRTLSIVDLIRAGTISREMAACAWRAMDEGASVLTGARPGGAGKTTLMAAVLNFLPPGVPLVTVDRPGVITAALDDRPSEPACYLVHEIGAGHWYGYLWGRDVARFLSLVEGNRRIASCLHADTLEELAGIVCSPPLGASPEALARVGLILFMHVDAAAGGYRRRVSTFYEADREGSHRLLFRWEAASDTFGQVDELRDPAGLAPYVELLGRLVDEGDVDSRTVRSKILRSRPGRGVNRDGSR